VWRDIITTESATALYIYADKFYSENACITVNEHMKGKVYYVGGGADYETLKNIAKEIVADSGICHLESPAGLEVYSRNHNGDERLIICNHTDREIIFDGTAYKPYESRIIRK
jgi:beta-galactosidase